MRDNCNITVLSSSTPFQRQGKAHVSLGLLFFLFSLFFPSSSARGCGCVSVCVCLWRVRGVGWYVDNAVLLVSSLSFLVLLTQDFLRSGRWASARHPNPSLAETDWILIDFQSPRPTDEDRRGIGKGKKTKKDSSTRIIWCLSF